jgi:hypothetical protein
MKGRWMMRNDVKVSIRSAPVMDPLAAASLTLQSLFLKSDFQEVAHSG